MYSNPSHLEAFRGQFSRITDRNSLCVQINFESGNRRVHLHGFTPYLFNRICVKNLKFTYSFSCVPTGVFSD